MKRRHKKAQLDFPIITFVVIVIGFIIFAPIMLKVFNNIRTPVYNGLNNVSSEAAAGFDKAYAPLVNWWDKIVIIAFFISVLLLFISAFMIDTHPLFVILYILVCFFLVIFSNNIMKAADAIYDGSQFNTADASGYVVTNQLPFMDYLRNNFFVILLGIIFITGVIMYGKIAWFGNNGGTMRGGGNR